MLYLTRKRDIFRKHQPLALLGRCSLEKGVRERVLLMMFLAHLFGFVPVQEQEGMWVLAEAV